MMNRIFPRLLLAAASVMMSLNAVAQEADSSQTKTVITLDDALSSIFRKDVNFFSDVVLKRNCSRRDRVSGNTFGTAFSIHFALNI